MTKRIAFITENFMGSILPLSRQLCEQGFVVDIYFYCRRIHEPEACHLDYEAAHYGINSIPKEAYSQITRYAGSDNINLFTISQIKPYASIPLLRDAISVISRRQIRNAAKAINARNYDAINMVCNYNMEHLRTLLHYLKGNVIVSLHEVWNHFEPSTTPSPLLKEAIDRQCKFIVFSDNSKKAIKEIKGIDMTHVSCIPFGVFESFKSLTLDTIIPPLPQKYFLFFGYILPYKGLNVLHEAVEILGEKLGDFKIVIAGRGADPTLEKIKNDERYFTITRFIKNSELATLFNSAYSVVCPYLTMSQSGIPQTAFAFNVPVIASDLDGFREIITEDIGMLFECGNATDLAKCMEEIIVNAQKREELSQNIKQFASLHPRYDWSSICNQYMKSICS